MHSKNPKFASIRKERAASRRRHALVRNILLVGGAGLIVLALLLAFMQGSSAQNVVQARLGVSLGNFTLTDIQGRTVQLSDYAGKPVLINAWATWCPPCRAEMPVLNQYYQAHAGDGFVLLAVNAGDTQDLAASFASQNSLAFPILLDPGTRLLSQLGIYSFPTSVLVGRDGKVKTIHVGMFTAQSIEAEITPLIASSTTP